MTSSLSFACATWAETLQDWSDAHAGAFAFFGGAARLLVPDSAKIAVIKACVSDPQVNRSYAELSRITTRLCCRRGRIARAKAKVEGCVSIVERWLLEFRDWIWYGPYELNAAVADVLHAPQ